MEYLTKKIGDNYRLWERHTILLEAPTGTGKTTFLLERLIPYILKKHPKKKLLYLVNRRLLKKQICTDIFMRYGTEEVFDSIILYTYQEFTNKITSGEIQDLSEYEAIIMDECHYFVSDSDFNPRGTVIPLEFISYYGIGKTMVFVSATMDEVKPVIEEAIKKVINAVYYEEVKPPHLSDAYRLKQYFEEHIRNLRRERKNIAPEACTPHFISPYTKEEMFERYERFKCLCVPDLISLAVTISKSKDKWLVFIDDKELANNLENLLIGYGMQPDEITVLNSKNIDDDKNADKVEKMLINQKFENHVLITTSVLDNGVSLRDPELCNLVVVTESFTSFMQMIGRIRSDDKTVISLYFILRDSIEFQRKMNYISTEIEIFKKLQSVERVSGITSGIFQVMDDIWSNVDCNDVRKIYLPIKGKELKTFYLWDRLEMFSSNKVVLVRNPLASIKLLKLYDILKLFYLFAQQDPLNVIYYQMRWIGKDKEDLILLQKADDKNMSEMLKMKLLGLGQMEEKQFKKELINLNGVFIEYFRRKFQDKGIRNDRPLKKEYFKCILEELSLDVVETEKDGLEGLKMVMIKERNCENDEL